MSFFSRNLEYLRKLNGLSQSELASKLKVNPSTISRWEKEDMGVTVNNAFDVSNFFNISLADLTGKDLTNISIEQQPMEEFELLFDKNKDILTEEDKEYIKFIVEKRKREIDKQLGKE